jgi:hypothetical protein
VTVYNRARKIIRFDTRLQSWQYSESIGKTLDLEIPNWCAANRTGTTVLPLFSQNRSHSTLLCYLCLYNQIFALFFFFFKLLTP